MIKVIGVRFRRAGKVYYFNPLDMMPGEKISEELLEIVRYYRTSGMELYGMEDETGETLLVIEN